jgi:hypothetical protein
MEGKIREIIRELRFEHELRELIREPFAADQFVEGAEFIIARNPLLGSQTEDPLVWAMPMAPIEGAQVVLYYSFDDTTVWLLSITRIVNDH